MTEKCTECGKEFDTEKGLHIHQSKKHSENETEGKKPDVGAKLNLSLKQISLIILFLGSMIGLISGYWFFSSENINSQPSDKNNTDFTGEDIEKIESIPYDVEFGLGSEDVTWNDEKVSLEGRPYMGDDTASVTIVSYEDYFCPWCAGFHNKEFAAEIEANSAFEEIIENHVETGQAEYYFKNFPVVGGERPAEVSECIANHGTSEAFWKFNYNHFQNYLELAETENSNTTRYNEIMLSWSEQLDVNSEAFENCIESNERNHIVQEDMNEAKSLGVDSTPTIIIDGEIISGTQTYNTYRAIIEDKSN